MIFSENLFPILRQVFFMLYVNPSFFMWVFKKISVLHGCKHSPSNVCNSVLKLVRCGNIQDECHVVLLQSELSREGHNCHSHHA